jgi:hypothetical protein
MDLGKHLDRYRILVSTPVVKKVGGINGPLTEIRALTAEMLGKDIRQIAKLTQGWSHQQLYILYKECQEFRKNPGALWWIKYKELNKKYANQKKINNKGLLRVGEERRSQKQEKGQSLF